MNALIRKGLCFSTAMVAAALVAMPSQAALRAPARDIMTLPATGFSTGETALVAASSPAAFADTSRAESAALFSITADEFSSSVGAPVAVSSSADALPEAPTPVAPESSALMFQAPGGGTASKYSMTISAGMTAQPLSAGDKFVLGVRNLANVESLVGVVISSGYSHLVNGQPNYGTNREAFAKRFGAGMARSSSQNIFTNSILAPVFHEDPRYYVEGPQHSFVHRLMYAATRPIITRTDSGHSTVNAAMLVGYAGAAAMTPLYYPNINHNFHDIAATYGSSLGGAAIGFGFSEFSDQLLKAVHLKH